jgi:hypothetical protein
MSMNIIYFMRLSSVKAAAQWHICIIFGRHNHCFMFARAAYHRGASKKYNKFCNNVTFTIVE